MLTPLDIQNKEFKKGVFGYDKLDVEEFMSLISDEYERLYKENISLKDKVNVLSDGILQYKTMEDTLQNALIVAQSAGEEVKKNAREKAENIIKEAELRSEEIVRDANKKVSDILSKYDDIKRNLDIYKAKMNSLINTQISIMNELTTPDDSLSNKDNI